MSVVPLPPRGEWLVDARDGGRAMRASWHAELGCVVLSSWRGDACVATVRLAPAEAAQLARVLVEGLGAAASAAGPVGGSTSDAGAA